MKNNGLNEGIIDLIYCYDSLNIILAMKYFFAEKDMLFMIFSAFTRKKRKII